MGVELASGLAQSLKIEPVGSFGNDAYNVHVVDNLAYVGGDNGQGLQIVDISNPANPTLKSRYPLESINDVQVVGNLAYITTDNGLQIIDVRDPLSPKSLGNCDTPGPAVSMQVVNTMAYVANGRVLQVINVSNPLSPKIVGSIIIGSIIGSYNTSKSLSSCPDQGVAYDVKVVNQVAYVACGQRCFQIIDVSNPASPKLLGKFSYGEIVGVQVVYPIAYLADILYPEGFHVIDVRNPSTPKALGSYIIPGGSSCSVRDVHVVGTTAYLSHYGLYVVDVSNPENPTLMASYDNLPNTRVFETQAVGDLVYVANGSGGLQILRVSGGETPTATPTRTATPTETATPTATPTPTQTSSKIPIKDGNSIYLPLISSNAS